MLDMIAGDGAQIFYQDWGSGAPVLFSHGWPRNSDSWAEHMRLLAGHGYRCLAHDRRGHGRSERTWHGNDMDTYADDLATLIEELDLRDLTLVGFCAGGGEVARYIGRHGAARLARVVLVAATPPLMLQTPDNPCGVRIEVFDALRDALAADRSQLLRDLADGVYFGHNRPGAAVPSGVRDAFWLQSMQAGLRGVVEGVSAFSATDHRADLDAIDVPALIIHGDDDQIAPLEVSGMAAATRIKDARLTVYAGAPHGIIDTHRQRLGDDLLAFLATAGTRS